MNEAVLYLATILIWIAVVVGTWQRIFQMPAWFSNPPASFELIRRQSGKSKRFWIPLSVLFIVTCCTALLLNWGFEEVRDHILIALACYITTGLLSGVYFVREILAFSGMPADAPQTPELLRRTQKWLRWTTVRDVLQWLTAISLTMACNNL